MKWQGLDAFKRELRDLPKALTADATVLVGKAAREAMETARREYPARTGNLRDGLRIRIAQDLVSTYGVAVRLQNAAPHAYMFENGTVARHNGIGARGIMPPGHVFLPASIQARSRMYNRLAEMMRTHGLTVMLGTFHE